MKICWLIVLASSAILGCTVRMGTDTGDELLIKNILVIPTENITM